MRQLLMRAAGVSRAAAMGYDAAIATVAL